MQPAVAILPLWAQITLAAVPALGAVFAAIALLLTVKQSRRTNAQVRAALVAQCLDRFVDDEKMQNVFYAIEYSEFRYDDNFHNASLERETDKLLQHFASLALAWKAGLLTITDVVPVEYYILCIMRNTEVNRYLDFVAAWARDANLGEHPYTALTEMYRLLTK
jgi:hypothetical protein